MDDSEKNLLTLQSHFNGISSIFKTINDNHLNSQNENKGQVKVLNDSLSDKSKSIAKLAKENENLQKELLFVTDKLSESERSISVLKETIRKNQKKFITKCTSFSKVIKTYQKHCKCAISNKLNDGHQQDINDLQNILNESKRDIEECQKTPLAKVFFEYPVSTNSISKEEYAPMTEQFSYGLSENHISTPIIGETEFVPCKESLESINVDVDNDEEDSVWLNSPSICVSRKFPSMSEISTGIKESTHVEFDPISIETPKRKMPKSFETSGELFSDSSPILNFQGKKKNKEQIVSISSWISSKNDSQNRSKLSLHKKQDNNIPLGKSSKENNIILQDTKDHGVVPFPKHKTNKDTKVSKKNKYNMNDDSFFADQDDIIEKKENIKFQIPKPILSVKSPIIVDPVTPDITNNNTPVNFANKMKKSDSLEDLDGSAFFDKLLNRNKQSKNFKCTEVIRGKAAREKLNGFDCHECRKYYASDNLTEEQLQEVLKRCSRHRHQATPPPDTQDEFWSIGFPETQEYIQKGYMLNDEKTLPNHMQPIWSKNEKKRIKYQ